MKYGCNTQGAGPRGRTRTYMVPAGWHEFGRDPVTGEVRQERVMRPVTTAWLPRKCGLLQQAGMGPDPACAGCENHEPGAEAA